jgi:tetratricopeptide (TPR) repeat protein
MELNETPAEEQEETSERANTLVDEGEITGNDQRATEQARQQGRLQEIRKAVNADPRNVDLLNQLGIVAEAAGDHDRALWAYKRAIRLNPESATAYLHLGRFYQQEGRTKLAVRSLQHVMKYSADPAQRQEAMEIMAGLLDRDGSPAEVSPGEAPGRQALAKEWEELDLTPAEALFLIDPDNSSGRKMMSYTLLDLAIRHVLDVTANSEVGPGENYDQAELRPHERLFAKYFSRFDDYVDVDRLTRAALSELNNRYDAFKGSYVLQSLIEKGYMEQETQRLWGLIPVPRYVPSEKGIRARNKVKRLLKKADSQIVRSLKSNPDQAKEYLTEGGPAILLLDEFPADYFQEWQTTLEELGFGPTIDSLKDRARQSSWTDLVNDFLQSLSEG